MPPRAFLKCLCLLAVIALATLLPTHTVQAQAQALAPAQTTTTSTSTPAPRTAAEQKQELQALVDTLSNEQTRNEFLARLRGLIDANAQTGTDPAAEERTDWLSGATQALGGFSASILGMAKELDTLPDRVSIVVSSLSDPTTLDRFIWAIGTIVGLLLVASLAELVVNRLLRRSRTAIEARSIGKRIAARVVLLLVRTILDILPIAAFSAVAFGILALVDLNYLVRLAVVMVLYANVISRLIVVLGSAILAPDVPSLRLFPVPDESAAYAFVWLKRFTHTAVYGFFLLRAAWLLGLTSFAYVFLGDLLGLLLVGMSIVFVLQVRDTVSQWIRRSDSPTVGLRQVRNQIADFWYLFAIAYLIAAYVVWVLSVPGGFLFLARASALSVIVIGIAGIVMVALRRLFEMLFRLSEETRRLHPYLEARANRYVPVLIRIAQGVVLLVCAVALLQIWGAQPLDWFSSPIGQGALGRVVSISIVLLTGAVAWELITIFADRIVARDANSARLKTLLPFLQNAFRIMLITILVLIILSELGVNTAPLIAGAGVFGLAIAFGAQALVKDVITGTFILLENTIAVGDVVEVGSHSGLVEKISIRTVHLRDFDGNVHTIPFGEVQTVKNMSKLFAYAVVDVNVSYRENIDEALAVMAEVAEGLTKEGPLAKSIIGPFEVVGVEALKDSSVWLRGRFKTVPLGQWNVRREYYRRIKAAFDERGIEIPFPHQTIYFGVDKKGSAPPVRIVNESGDPALASNVPAAPTNVPGNDTQGPMIEEHPGAQQRLEPDDDDLLPSIETKPS